MMATTMTMRRCSTALKKVRGVSPPCPAFNDLNRASSEESEDDMDMDAFGEDFKVVPKGKHKAYEVEYDSLSQAAVEKLMKQDVEHICGIFGVDVGISGSSMF